MDEDDDEQIVLETTEPLNYRSPDFRLEYFCDEEVQLDQYEHLIEQERKKPN